MKILSIECSATPCSAAIIDGGKILASGFVNVKLTHSQTLMPMIDSVLKSALLGIQDIDGFALSYGPGSFTGIRIGISAVKGMAAAKKMPCVGVSTLRAMAENYRDTDCIVCAVMDARCNQVYNALFHISGGVVTRLCDDRALLCQELKAELGFNYVNKGEKIIVVGDGTDVFLPFVEEYADVAKPSEQRKFQNAVGVGMAAAADFENGNTVSPEELLPVYLRLPQAERELKLKLRSEEK